ILIVVQGAGGIGNEVGFAFAESGVNSVLFADLDGEAATEAAEESRKLATNPAYKAFGIKADLTKVDWVQSMVDAAVKEFGAIDYCINAAGVDVASYIPFADTLIDDYDRVLDINTKGVFIKKTK
ncbi:NAD(P)-binding protein, partial [Zopfia rhizophila CBS 207.26]